MVQVLNVTVPIQIPKDYQLISNDEYNQLKSESMQGRMWTMGDLRKWLGDKSAEWIKDNILFNPKYSKTIQEWRRNKVLTGGGYGRPYHFKAAEVSKWIDDHWTEFKW